MNSEENIEKLYFQFLENQTSFLEKLHFGFALININKKMNNIEIVNGIKLKKEVKSKENLKILIIDLEKNIKQKFTKIDFENILEFLDTINYNYLYKLYNMDIKQIKSIVGREDNNRETFFLIYN